MEHFRCVTHHALLLLSLTLGKSNGQLQLLLLLQRRLVPLGRHLLAKLGKLKCKMQVQHPKHSAVYTWSQHRHKSSIKLPVTVGTAGWSSTREEAQQSRWRELYSQLS